MSREKYPKISFNALKLYFGDPYEIDVEDAIGKLTVYQPTIGDIVEIGEDKFNPFMHLFVANTTLYRTFLWDNGLDWNEVSDFQLFCLLYKTIDPDASRLVFGDLDWNGFEVYFKNEGEMILASKEANVEINETVYQHFHQYLQNMFRMFPEDELTNDKILKKWWIDKDKRAAKRKEEKKDEENIYSLQSQISSFVNHPGTKYKLHELKEVGICEFYDSLERLRIYENATAVLRGMFSGMVDGSKIKPEQYDWMKQVH